MKICENGIIRNMTAEEIAWVNNYHKIVFEKLSPMLDEESKQWLAQKTREL